MESDILKLIKYSIYYNILRVRGHWNIFNHSDNYLTIYQDYKPEIKQMYKKFEEEWPFEYDLQIIKERGKGKNKYRYRSFYRVTIPEDLDLKSIVVLLRMKGLLYTESESLLKALEDYNG